MHPSTLLTFLLTSSTSLAAAATLPPRNPPPDKNTTSSKYILKDDLTPTNFFSAFDFYTAPDPTHGFVQYLNASSAASSNLIGIYNNTSTVYIGVDSVFKDPLGRASVRLESKKTWNKGLLVADIHHMPASECGVWPAFWMLSRGHEWPEGGEVDIVEGVNEQVGNVVTLHTSEGCVVDNSSIPSIPTTSASGGSESESSLVSAKNGFTGTLTTKDCDVNAQDQGKNVGCSIAAPEYETTVQMGGTQDLNTPLTSFGTPFNDAEGGVYAMEWTSTSISVWFIPRYSALFDTHFTSSSSPSSSPSNSTAPDPTLWDLPIAHFSGSGCDFEQRFKDLQIIFNIAFCGDWAGKEWDKTCKKKTGVETCEAYVRDNPGNFEEAFWEVGRVQWWERE